MKLQPNEAFMFNNATKGVIPMNEITTELRSNSNETKHNQMELNSNVYLQPKGSSMKQNTTNKELSPMFNYNPKDYKELSSI